MTMECYIMNKCTNNENKRTKIGNILTDFNLQNITT